MAKTYLQVEDNILDKYLLVKTKEIGEHFYNSQNEINELRRQIIQFYADQFTDGDFDTASKIIEI